MSELDRVVAKIEADTSEFIAELRKATAATQDFEKKSQSSFGKIGGSLKDFVKNLASVRTALVAAGGATGLLYFTAQAFRSAEQLLKTSERLGLTAARLQELRFAAEKAGMSTGDLEVGLRFLSRNLGEAARGGGENRYIFEQLGLVGADLNTAIDRISDAFKGSTDASGKMNLAMQIFGRGGAAMVDILNEGSGGLRTLSDRARELGLVLSEDLLKRAAAADDEFDEMFAIFKKIGLNIAFEFIPVMKKVAQVFTDPDFIAGTKGFASAIGEVVSFVSQHGDAIIRVTSALGGLSIGARIGGAPGAIGGAIIGGGFKEAIEVLEKLGLLKKEMAGPPAYKPPPIKEMPGVLTDEQRKAMERLLDPATRYLGLIEKENTANRIWLDQVQHMPDLIDDITRKMEVDTEARQKNIDTTTEMGAVWALALTQSKMLAENQRDVRAAIEGTRTEQEKINKDLERLEELKPHLPLEVYQRRIEQLVPHLRRLGEAAEEMGKIIASAFEEAIFSAGTLREQVQALLNDVQRIIFRKTITEPLGDFLSGGLKNIFGLSSAKGNVFSGPIQPFARGGVVSGPTVFPMARGVGLMGEKGPEAVMPLRRTQSGHLGVRADGFGGGRTEVNVYAPPGSQVRQDREQIGDGERINIFIDQAVADNVQSPGTRTFRALQSTFALSQQGISR